MTIARCLVISESKLTNLQVCVIKLAAASLAKCSPDSSSLHTLNRTGRRRIICTVRPTEFASWQRLVAQNGTLTSTSQGVALAHD